MYIHTAAGAAHEVERAQVPRLVSFMDVVRPGKLRLPTTAQKRMRGMFLITWHGTTWPSLCCREGVRIRQVEGCELCEVQPRIVGTMCIACDRLIGAGPRLRELSSDNQVFKNRKLNPAHFHIPLKAYGLASSNSIPEWMGFTFTRQSSVSRESIRDHPSSWCPCPAWAIQSVQSVLPRDQKLPQLAMHLWSGYKRVGTLQLQIVRHMLHCEIMLQVFCIWSKL